MLTRKIGAMVVLVNLLWLFVVGCQHQIPKGALELSPETIADRQLQSRVFETGDESRLLAANSLYLAVCTGAVALPWGTVLAALLARTDLPGRRPAMILIGSMLFIPLYLQVAGWLAGFGMGGWYTWLSGTAASEPLLYGWRGAIWIHALAALPWVTLIVGMGLVTIPPEWEESALLDGTPWQVFRPDLASAA